MAQNGWTRRQTLWLLTGTATSLTLHACTQPAQTGAGTATKKASMGVEGWIGFTPLFIALEKGFYKEFGVDLNAPMFKSGSDSQPAFVSGQIDGLGAVSSSTVVLAAKGKNLQVVMVEDLSLGADGILARNSISDIKDFKGKTIAVETDGVSHFFLLQVLADAGLTDKDVELINVTPDAAAAAYQSGKVDIAVTYMPYLGKASAAQKDGRVIFDSSKKPTAIADLYVFDRQFIEANPSTVEGFIRGTFKGLDYLNNNRTDGLAIAAKKLQITPEELDEQLKGIKLPNLAENIEMLSNLQSSQYIGKPLETLAKFLKDHGKIDKTPDVATIIEPKFVKSIA
jgi:NitT/TauT family transport system substrate-binding protein